MAETDFLDAGSRESRGDDKTSADLVARWLAELELAGKAEEEWRKDADRARQIYRAEEDGKDQRFNILFSNVQTEVPNLYNSTPTPDVRTRYSEDDEVSRLTCQTIERLLSYSVDTYDFDGTMKACVQDRQLAGRGVARVRYKPYEHKGQVYQEVSCEHVAWKHVRLGPATAWEDTPWIAFEHFLTRDQLTRLAPDVGSGVNLDMAIKSGDQIKAEAAPNVFKRACVWEIWDRQSGKVYWIAKSTKARPIRIDDDPLGLIGFFPMPEPMYGIRTAGSMVPVCPYRIIEPLVDELEEITGRIQALIKVIKWRGFRHPALPSFERMSEAEDGELLDASEDVLSLVQAGGLDKYVWLMPIDQAIKTVQALYEQRESIKQTIFEVSGLSDILRGQSNPNETLGAQEIKANSGSMRMQDGQKDVQRFCRDLFRLKAEIACNLFSSQNLRMMTGMKQPPRQAVEQAKARLQQMQMPPQMGHNGGPPIEVPPDVAETASAVAWEDILDLVKSGATRTYRIDIESDSTIRGEIRTQQDAAAQFLQGTAQFIEAMGPAIQSGMMTPDVAVDLYSSFARLFKLGKQAEDALSRMGQKAQEIARNPPPKEPDPEQQKLQAEVQRSQAELQLKRQMAQQDVTLKEQMAAHDRAMKEAEFAHQAKLEETKLHHATRIEEYKMQSQAAMQEIQLQSQQELKHRELEMQREKMGQDASLKHREFELQSNLKNSEFQHQSRLAEFSHKHRVAMEDAKPGSKKSRADAQARDQAREAKLGEIADTVLAAIAAQNSTSAQHAQAFQGMLDTLARQNQHLHALGQSNEQLAQAIKRPRRIVRDPKTNRVVGMEVG